MPALLAGAALLLLGVSLISSLRETVSSWMPPVSVHVRVYRPLAATPVPATPPSVAPLASSSVEAPGVIEAAPITAPALQLQSGRVSWELQLDAVLESKLSKRQKAFRLLSQLRAMPPEAFATVTQEMVDHLPDGDYPAVLPLLLSPDTHGAVVSVLYGDLLERPDRIALPALLSLIKTPNHPFAQTAQESLGLLVGEDHGDEWTNWERAVAQLLSGQVQR